MIQMPSNLNDLRATWRFANNLASETKSSLKIQNSTDFYIYGMIGVEDGEAESFVKAVADSKGKPINLHINSPGGFVWDAVAMYDSLVNSNSKVHVSIDGIAASAASFLAMSADPGMLQIAESGRMMIHDVQGSVMLASPAEMQEYTDLLHSVSDDIAGIYARRAGGDPKAWRKAMTATTWYNSSQAVDSKLVDRVAKTTTNASSDNRTRLIKARHKVLVKG